MALTRQLVRIHSRSSGHCRCRLGSNIRRASGVTLNSAARSLAGPTFRPPEAAYPTTYGPGGRHMHSHRRTTLDGRLAKRLLLVPALGLALTGGAAPAGADSGGKALGGAKKDTGKAADHRPAGVGGGRRI